jgi:hypothetical protein
MANYCRAVIKSPRGTVLVVAVYIDSIDSLTKVLLVKADI